MPELLENINLKRETSENEFVIESYVKKFQNLAKEYLELDINTSIEPIQKVKEASRFKSFALPANLSEFFIRFEESHVFWSLDTAINSYIEDFFKLYFSKSSGYEFFKTAKENYQKWVLNKSLAEKKYFANSIITLAEKKFINNFYFYLLLSSVYSNEKSQLNYGKALEMLDKAEESVLQNKLTEVYRDELLYYINLFAGFIYLKQNEYNTANEKFTDAIRVNPFGILAKFYLALTEIKMGHKEVVGHLLKEIMSYDIFRCSHAVNSYNAGMLHFFVKNPVIKNIFYYNEFSAVSESLEKDFLEITAKYDKGYENFVKKIKSLDEIKLDEYFSQESFKTYSFLVNVISLMSNAKSILFFNVLPEIETKFQLTINSFIQVIKNKYAAVVQEKLSIYNSKIEEKMKEAEALKAEQDEYIKKIKERLHLATTKVEENAVMEIAEIEDRIANIGNSKEMNPKSSFGTAMTYNFILAILVFMMGGCAGYSDSFMNSVWEFKDVVGLIIVSGMKWGGISFLSGILLAFGFAGYISVQRSNEKQWLVKQISFAKEQKETDLETLKKDYETSEKSLVAGFSKRINEKNEAARVLGEERDEREKVFYAEAEEQNKEEIKKLQSFLTNPS